MNNPYVADKINYHPLHLESLRNNIPIAPLHVQLIPTNVCNQRCSFCSYRQKGYSSNATFDDRNTIPFSKLAEIISSCEEMGVRAIQLTGGGEPTCHPQFLLLCETILNAGIDLAVVSNGSLWTESHVDCLRKAKWIRLSLDAGLANTYGSIRGVSPLYHERVRKIIRMLTHPKERPTIGVGFVINRSNWKEIVPATLKAKQDGADNIRLSAVFQNEGARYFEDIENQISILCQEAESFSTDKFKVINLFKNRIDDLSQGTPNYEDCHFSKLTTYIGADMNVYRCCVYSYNELGLLGSLKEKTFKDLWFSKEVQHSLTNFNAASCARCMFNDKNIQIQKSLNLNSYQITNPPDHVNFI